MKLFECVCGCSEFIEIINITDVNAHSSEVAFAKINNEKYRTFRTRHYRCSQCNQSLPEYCDDLEDKFKEY